MKSHSVPAIYNPDIPLSVKCSIMVSLCCAMARLKGIELDDMRTYLIDKLNVDFKELDKNQVGMFILYEYLYSQRPAACDCGEKLTDYTDLNMLTPTFTSPER